MKTKCMALLLVMMMFVMPASAQELPDAGICLCADGVLVASDVVLESGIVCDLWLYEHNAETEEGVQIWLYLADLEGFILRRTKVDGCDAWEALSANGSSAVLVPDYGGAALLIVEKRMKDTARHDDEEPFAVWQEEVDCPYCHGGRCSLCNGSGVYRAYGVSSPCDPHCAACDGRGTLLENRWN